MTLIGLLVRLLPTLLAHADPLVLGIVAVTALLGLVLLSSLKMRIRATSRAITAVLKQRPGPCTTLVIQEGVLHRRWYLSVNGVNEQGALAPGMS